MTANKVLGSPGGSSQVHVRDPQTNGYFPKSGNDYSHVEFTIASGTSSVPQGLFFDGMVYTGFGVKVSGDWTAANLELCGSISPTGGFAPIRDADGYLVEISGIVSGTFWYTFPTSESFPYPYYTVRSKAVLTDANVLQAGDRNLIFVMKG